MVDRARVACFLRYCLVRVTIFQGFRNRERRFTIWAVSEKFKVWNQEITRFAQVESQDCGVVGDFDTASELKSHENLDLFLLFAPKTPSQNGQIRGLNIVYGINK